MGGGEGGSSPAIISSLKSCKSTHTMCVCVRARVCSEYTSKKQIKVRCSLGSRRSARGGVTVFTPFSLRNMLVDESFMIHKAQIGIMDAVAVWVLYIYIYIYMGSLCRL